MARSWILMGIMVLTATSVDAQVTQQWVAQEGAVSLTAIASDGLGSVYVTGSCSHCAGDPPTDYVTFAYDAMTGTKRWGVLYDGGLGSGSYNYASAIAVDGSGRVYVTGWSVGDATGYDYATVAYDSMTGTQLWVARYHGPTNGYDLANAIAVDGSGRVYVTGTSEGGVSGNDYATVAYDAMTGTQLWVARYDGPASGNDYAAAVVVDGSGRVYVTGGSAGGASGNDYATVAYDAMTGTQLWVARYNGPANGDDGAGSLAVDGMGGVYVNGASSSVFPNGEYATVAYDAATGTQRWVARYGSRIDPNGGGAIAADGLGTVYITASTVNAANGFDYATVAYDAMTGAQRWAARYGDPYTISDATAIALDGTGAVYVTGSSGSSGFDYATVAYDALTGAELWVSRYHAGFARGIAVDGSGGVYVTGSSVGGDPRTGATVAYSQP